MVQKYPFSFPLTSREIQIKRASILSMLLRTDAGFCSIPVKEIQVSSLYQMLRSYDDLFFSGFLSKSLGNLSVSLSTRLTSSAGKFIFVKGLWGRISHAEIRMSSDFLTRLTDGPFDLNGLCVSTPQEAFLVVFEHELCHAVEAVLFGKTGHSQRFMAIANGIFGHTKTRHSLPTRRQEAAQNGLTLGRQVCFIHRGHTLCGVISYIGKTATVMVPSSDGDYRDRHGRRYTKYRVPIEQLKI